MSPKEAASKGGKIIGERIRKAALERYYENPSLCKQCNKIIHPREKEKLFNVKKKQFCNRSCAAKYNNVLYPKRVAQKTGLCETCGEIIQFKKMTSGKYTPRKFCDRCLPAARLRTLSRTMGYKTSKPVEDLTKAEYLDRRGNYTAARNSVSKKARETWNASGKPKTCAICDFPHGVQICHKRPVADFPDDALIKEINDIKNLIALCPNHHWMLDHGLLNLDNPVPE